MSYRSLPFVLLTVAWLGLSAEVGTAQETARPSGDRGLFAEPGAIARAADLAEKYTAEKPSKDGFYVEFGNMITGSGWISAGPGYRRKIFNDRARFSTSAALSWRLYTMARASVDVPKAGSQRFSYGGGVLYQDALQVNYFGLGNESTASSRSGYRLRSFDADLHSAYVRGPATLQARVGWLPSIAVRSMAGRLPKYPHTESVFTEFTAPGLVAQPSFAHADIGATFDVRDQPSRPTAGGVYGATLTRYSDLDRGRYSFNLMQLEGAHYVPLAGSRWVMALRAWGAFTSTGDGQTVPFYLMPNVGGKNSLRGFPDYRFYGQQMVLFGAESRWAVFPHVDAAVFVDAGRVAVHVRDLDLSGMHTSVGAGIRFHTERSTLARLDVAHSIEGWQVVLKLTESFKRTTFSGNLSPTVPFVP